ncbi:MAG: methionyl-tRNA formyltransferase, partial [Gammaproteobacteria bacterium]|nr:methionyl-tRNA formyltransferase [Gammaproteobacteria bacterium]
NPWPVCFTHLGDMTLRIWQAEALPTSSGKTPGQILKCAKDGILVACGEGTLNITALQLPNKRTMSAQEILNGHRSLFEPLPCLS